MNETAGFTIEADLAAPRSVVESGVIAVALADQVRLHFANNAFYRLFNRPVGPADFSLLELVEPSGHQRLEAALAQAKSQAASCRVRAIQAGGGNLRVEFRFAPANLDGRSLIAVSAQDVTQQSRYSTQLSLLAYSDPLTALANRALLMDRMHQAMMQARHGGDGFAVLALDLDRLKPVNDTYGHAAGDQLLRRIAQRLVACLRDTDTVARIGGDEFAILLPSVKGHDHACLVAERILEQVALPVALASQLVCVAASMGIAFFPEHAGGVDELLAAADGALYAAKQRGGNAYALADAPLLASTLPPPLVWDATHELGVPEIDRQHARLAELLNELGYALRNAQPHRDIMQQVIDFTAFHFTTEERLMQECGYAGAVQHAEMHQKLLDDLRGLQTEGIGVSVSLVLRYLQEWLFRHLDGADRDLATALLAGRTPQAIPAA